MKKSAQQVVQTLADNFAILGDWTERYKYIIELGAKMPAFPEEYKVDAYKVKGCLSQVWMHVEVVDDHLHFQAISDSAIVSGLIAILMMVYNERRPEDILAISTDFTKQLQLEEHLSPTRNNGLYAMLKQIMLYAQTYAAATSVQI